MITDYLDLLSRDTELLLVHCRHLVWRIVHELRGRLSLVRPGERLAMKLILHEKRVLLLAGQEPVEYLVAQQHRLRLLRGLLDLRQRQVVETLSRDVGARFEELRSRLRHNRVLLL